jgi:hypothetical protein
MQRFYLIVLVLMLSNITVFASGPTLPTVDPSPIFDSLNTFLPWAFNLLAKPAGIILGFLFARWFFNELNWHLFGKHDQRNWD